MISRLAATINYFIVKGDKNLKAFIDKDYNHQRSEVALFEKELSGSSDIQKFDVSLTTDADNYYVIFAAFYISSKINIAFVEVRRPTFEVDDSVKSWVKIHWAEHKNCSAQCIFSVVLLLLNVRTHFHWTRTRHMLSSATSTAAQMAIGLQIRQWPEVFNCLAAVLLTESSQRE